MSKVHRHTEGPWIVSETPSGKIKIWSPKVVDVANGDIWQKGWVGQPSSNRPKEKVANGILMAASPTMLDALERVLQWSKDQDPDNALNVFTQVELAIAQALAGIPAGSMLEETDILSSLHDTLRCLVARHGDDARVIAAARAVIDRHALHSHPVIE